MNNWMKLWRCIVLPSVYKPLLFIFLVVISPGITDAMFYFRSDVLGFDSDTFTILNVCSSIATIVGVWMYRVCFQRTSFRPYMVCITICFALVQGSNIILVKQKTESWLAMTPKEFSIGNQFVYGLVNELHIMPLMVLAA